MRRNPESNLTKDCRAFFDGVGLSSAKKRPRLKGASNYVPAGTKTERACDPEKIEGSNIIFTKLKRYVNPRKDKN